MLRGYCCQFFLVLGRETSRNQIYDHAIYLSITKDGSISESLAHIQDVLAATDMIHPYVLFTADNT
jgi:hypothetical protein